MIHPTSESDLQDVNITCGNVPFFQSSEGIVLKLLAAFLLIFTTGRLLMIGLFFNRVESLYQIIWACLGGFATDLVTALALTLPAALYFLLIPERPLKTALLIPTLYVLFTMLTSIALEVAGLAYSIVFECRPNRIFYEYLVFPKEVFATVVTGFPVSAFILVVSIIATPLALFRPLRTFLSDFDGSNHKRKNYCLIGYMCLFLILPGMILRDWPLLFTLSSVTGNRVLDNAAMNSVSSSFCAIMTMYDSEHNMTKYYGPMEQEEIRARLSRYASPRKKTSEKLLNDSVQESKPNLVFILEESLSARFCGHLGGQGLTPHLDELSKTGICFTNMYSNGDRTVRGIEATVCGIVPTAGRGITKLPVIPRNFFSLAALLRKNGYATDFVYGGDKDFDYMWNFFKQTGFQNVYDELNNTKTDVFHGPWGICDGDLFNRAIDVFNSHGSNPFFGYILTTSLHDPFAIPQDSITPDDTLSAADNAVRYADHALGKFFKDASLAPWYKNTVFVIVADHNLRVNGPGLIPVDAFRIPAVITGCNVPKVQYGKISHQIDLVPTILHLLNVGYTAPIMGYNILTAPTDTKQTDRAFIVTGYTSAIVKPEEMVVLTPRVSPQYFVKKEGRFVSTDKANPDLAKDCRAFSLSTDLLLGSDDYRSY